MKIARTSIITGVRRELDLPITHEQLTAWENGVLAQDAFPHLTPSQREFIITGITGDEWEEYMSDGDEPGLEETKDDQSPSI